MKLLPAILPARRNRGGATFTMVIFVMLLISSGLMYYYFHRTQVLERELSMWKAGAREPELSSEDDPAAVGAASTPKSQVRRESLRDLAARLAGTPATQAVQPPQVEDEASDAVAEEQQQAPPGETPEQEEVAISPSPAVVASTPRRQPTPTAGQSPPLLQALPPKSGTRREAARVVPQGSEAADDVDILPEPGDRVVSTPPGPTETPAPTRGPRSTPRSAEAEPSPRPARPTAVPGKETPITSLYDLPATGEPTVKVRAPRRTPSSR